jgi:hypothetical protein
MGKPLSSDQLRRLRLLTDMYLRDGLHDMVETLRQLVTVDPRANDVLLLLQSTFDAYRELDAETGKTLTQSRLVDSIDAKLDAEIGVATRREAHGAGFPGMPPIVPRIGRAT